MNKLINTLDAAQWTLIGISLVEIKDVLNIILICISIAVGILSLLLKVRQYSKDGIIDEKEKADLDKDIEDLKNKLK